MRSRSRSVTVGESYRASAPPTDGYLRTTMSITDVSGTSSPSRNHHFDSHMWQVVNMRSRSLTDIEIVMRSPCLHSGQVPGVVSGIVRSVSVAGGRKTIAPVCHLSSLPRDGFPTPRRLLMLGPRGTHGLVRWPRAHGRGPACSHRDRRRRALVPHDPAHG